MALAAPFYHSRVEKLGKNELIYYYAYDRRWMDRNKVELLLKRGIDQGLIRTEGDFYFLLFDIAEVQIPTGYKPSSAIFEIEDPVQQLIDRIGTRTGVSEEEVVSRMNEMIRDHFDGNISPKAALVIIARSEGAAYTDLLPALKAETLKKE
jgi:hypothetical protein